VERVAGLDEAGGVDGVEGAVADVAVATEAAEQSRGREAEGGSCESALVAAGEVGGFFREPPAGTRFVPAGVAVLQRGILIPFLTCVIKQSVDCFRARRRNLLKT
jgi:hypothetical protein